MTTDPTEPGEPSTPTDPALAFTNALEGASRALSMLAGVLPEAAALRNGNDLIATARRGVRVTCSERTGLNGAPALSRVTLDFPTPDEARAFALAVLPLLQPAALTLDDVLASIVDAPSDIEGDGR